MLQASTGGIRVQGEFIHSLIHLSQLFHRLHSLLKLPPSHQSLNNLDCLPSLSRALISGCEHRHKYMPIISLRIKTLLYHRPLVSQQSIYGPCRNTPEPGLIPDHALAFVFFEARTVCLADGVGFRGGVDAGGADALRDAVGCKLGFAVGGGLFGPAV